ncbi:MAG: GTP-binding protein [Candidatus Helarchaeota archaeon]|nr:GTP-binding protein [Candidatus Helarchaeota archaeon]
MKRKGNIVKANVLKIIVGGDGGIGKTTLLKVFSGESYSDQDMTVGFEIFVKRISIENNEEILQIWDLGGQDHFRFLLPTCFRGAHGVILGFDMSRRSSFMNLRNWMNILREKCPRAPVVLIATKADKGYHPILTRTMAVEFVNNHHLVDFVEVSAKNRSNVFTPFKRLVEEIKSVDPRDVKIAFSREVEEPNFDDETQIYSKLQNYPISKVVPTFSRESNILLPLNKIIDFENDIQD